MQFNVYDNKTGEPFREEVYAISEGGTLYRLDLVRGDSLQAVPIKKSGDYTIQFFPDEADGENGWRCPKEVY